MVSGGSRTVKLSKSRAGTDVAVKFWRMIGVAAAEPASVAKTAAQAEPINCRVCFFLTLWPPPAQIIPGRRWGRQQELEELRKQLRNGVGQIPDQHLVAAGGQPLLVGVHVTTPNRNQLRSVGHETHGV